MSRTQEIISQVGAFLDWAYDGPLDEWLEEAGYDLPTDEVTVEKVIRHIKHNIQAKDVK